MAAKIKCLYPNYKEYTFYSMAYGRFYKLNDKIGTQNKSQKNTEKKVEKCYVVYITTMQ